MSQRQPSCAAEGMRRSPQSLSDRLIREETSAMVRGGLVVELLHRVQHVGIIPRARLRANAAAVRRRALPSHASVI